MKKKLSRCFSEWVLSSSLAAIYIAVSCHFNRICFNMILLSDHFFTVECVVITAECSFIVSVFISREINNVHIAFGGQS